MLCRLDDPPSCLPSVGVMARATRPGYKCFPFFFFLNFIFFNLPKETNTFSLGESGNVSFRWLCSPSASPPPCILAFHVYQTFPLTSADQIICFIQTEYYQTRKLSGLLFVNCRMIPFPPGLVRFPREDSQDLQGVRFGCYYLGTKKKRLGLFSGRTYVLGIRPRANP